MTENRAPLTAGLLHPLNLIMLGTSVLAGLVAAWWLFPLGLLLWGFMVFNIVQSPKLQFEHEERSRDPLAARYRQLFGRFRKAERAIIDKIETAPAKVRRALDPLRGAIDDLSDHAHQVLKRLSSFEQYFQVSSSIPDMKNELRHIDDATPLLTNDRLKKEYEEKRVELERELTRLEATSGYVDRTEAEVTRLADELDRIVAEVLNLTGRDPNEAKERVEALVIRIERLTEQFEAYEREDVAF